VIHTWADAPIEELVNYAKQRVKNYQVVWDVDDMPSAFVEWSRHVIEDELGAVVSDYYDTVSALLPAPDNNPYQHSFPHNHAYDGHTLVLYVQAPESGGEFVLFDDDMQPVFEHLPIPGTAVVIEDHQIHAVKKVEGSVPRIALIAGGYRYGKGSEKCRCGKDWQRIAALRTGAI
jgi:hypothetical protein